MVPHFLEKLIEGEPAAIEQFGLVKKKLLFKCVMEEHKKMSLNFLSIKRCLTVAFLVSLIAVVWFNFLRPTVRNISFQTKLTHLQVQTNQVGIGLFLFKKEFGQFPKSLSELTPEYLDAEFLSPEESFKSRFEGDFGYFYDPKSEPVLKSIHWLTNPMNGLQYYSTMDRDFSVVVEKRNDYD